MGIEKRNRYNREGSIMSIKRYIANKDNTITNAFKDNLITRASSSNMGASDILEVFSIYGQASTSSLEKARVLVQFPTSEISTDRTNSTIPASGSVNFVLKMSNAEHSSTTPENFILSVHVITSASWDEGYGIDMETYKNTGASNWVSSSTGNAWNTEGADYLTSSYAKHVSFGKGTENLEVDISDIVEDWLDSSIPNYGLLVKLSGSNEDGSLEKSFYTKRFFARSSHHFFKRPNIEARWDGSTQDDRNNIIRSSSLAPAADNLNNIYLYNKVRGNLRDIPSTGSHLLVQLYPSIGSGVSAVTLPADNTNVKAGAPTHITASRQDTGIYKATFSCDNTGSTFYDVWQKSTGNGGSRTYTALMTGSGFTLESDTSKFYSEVSEYVVNITNLKPSYNKEEVAKFRINTRNKSWQPNIYTVAKNSAPVDNIREGYYKIKRHADDYVAIPYSTGSSPSYSKLSYDVSGSFFDLDMSILEPNYLYEISFLRKDNDEYVEQKEKFKFRVDS